MEAAREQDLLSRKTEKWSKPEKYGVRMTTLGYRRYESVRFYVLQGDISSSMVSLSLDGEGRKFYVFQLTWNGILFAISLYSIQSSKGFCM